MDLCFILSECRVLCETVAPLDIVRLGLPPAVLASKNTAMHFVSEDVWRLVAKR